jgi:hypothetical protein
VGELFNLQKMKDLIRTRVNLSAPEMDKLTNPIMKLERDSAAEMMVEVMKMIINTQQFPEEWRGARTILLFKGCEEDDSKNWDLSRLRVSSIG